MRRNLLATFVLSFVFSAAAISADLPPALSHMEALAGDEQRLAAAVRDFDRQQCRLAQWDMDLAEELAMAGDKDLAQETMERAKDRLTMVQQAYNYVLERYPDNGRALTYYAELLYDYQGDHAKAIMLWKKASALYPELSEPLNNLALHYCHTGDLSMGLAYFDKALKLEPNHPDYLFNLCQIYLTHFPEVAKRNKWSLKKVYRTAMKMSKKAAELSNEYELIQDYAVNFFAAQNFQLEADWREAARAWQWARQKARTTDEEFYTWLNEARVWIADGNKAKARECLDAALAIRPGNDVATNLLSKL
ncbi:MAG TPA: hypothetical protein PLM14_05155 [Candidatus Hydrogenedentes bacterium]|nr:hypothetical protein [Candidatus Hydrogenedentota bacterium]HQE82365.1 hypothetical protein [Candidatus Hydrogenedentota bacterium]HQH54646.1 hypothetical protein [Candidatus Hydrogenedentota bacterium]HQM47184.1 hypothetical protein [Candidatus Hydrogenedentota bacterium]